MPVKESVVGHHTLVKDFDDCGIRWNDSTELQSPKKNIKKLKNLLFGLQVRNNTFCQFY